jgi:hypothetical protein
MWKTHQLLNTRQVAALIGENPYGFDRIWEAAGLPEPYAEGPLWTPDQIRPVIRDRKDDPAHHKAKAVKWQESELLDTKQCAALHFPIPSKKDSESGAVLPDRGVQETTWNSYVRRTIQRREQGKDSTNEAPLPAGEVRGHPLWSPVEIREYLINRPGPGYHVSGETRRGYRGGRVPVGAAKALATTSSGA